MPIWEGMSSQIRSHRSFNGRECAVWHCAFSSPLPLQPDHLAAQKSSPPFQKNIPTTTRSHEQPLQPPSSRRDEPDGARTPERKARLPPNVTSRAVSAGRFHRPRGAKIAPTSSSRTCGSRRSAC
ncbi:hypothetical protein BDY17DRAFT_299412 [Neohortaea acidophila]|uniref:Uncharacterized protein n=1 Tax=Neohortaea acidophila TaxID=245834 RepID=A0A6A6PNR1_9PEZI|nr:uncharacterized protein BDY17DRAFT_299412 [Neohortaea acidophila]KAF2481652.1 hypothetical protein BDY17DRAFT_299412 [Neohortaea acidophila]